MTEHEFSQWFYEQPEWAIVLNNRAALERLLANRLTVWDVIEIVLFPKKKYIIYKRSVERFLTDFHNSQKDNSL